MGLLHSFCSEMLAGSRGSERAEDADRSAAPVTTDVVLFGRVGADAVGIAAGGGIESMMI